MLRESILTAIAMSLTACGGGGQAPAASPSGSLPITASPPRPYPQTDQQIAELVYSTGERTPAGFYSDPVPTGASYVTTAHLKDSDIAVAPVHDHPIHELCTDDWTQALEWSETAAKRMPSYADLVETNSEVRYFEFVRVPRDAPTSRARQRVFRCSYLDRTGTDSGALDGPGGRVNLRPLAMTDVQHLAEYLWHFTTFNNFGNAVLVSAPDSARGALAHSLTIATLSRTTSPATCDRIDVVRWSHAADSATGTLTRSAATLATLHARESYGLVTMCEAP